MRTAHFAWPPPDDMDRQPYRGLHPFSEQDAAVFFGRDRAITKGLDTLRRMRRSGAGRILAIVGPSGAGKTSYLHAGLLARLRRDPQTFAILPVIGHATDARQAWATLGLTGEPPSEQGVREQIERAVGAPMESEPNGAKTPVLAIDPAEDLLSDPRGAEFVRQVLNGAPNAIVVLTVRDDQIALLDQFDREPVVAVVDLRLPALSLQNYDDIIIKPGQLRTPPLKVSVERTEQFVADLSRRDALPLLALTLERLSSSHQSVKTVDFAEHVRGMGGISGAINASVTAAYEGAIRDPTCPTNRTAMDVLIRKTLIPSLAELTSSDAKPHKRRADLKSLPKGAPAMLDHLVRHGLIARFDDGASVELSHDAVLRNWWGLAEWLREERFVLERLEQVKRAAEEWDVYEHSRDLLVHRGDRLEAAEALLKRQDLARALAGTPMDYLAACRASETQLNERQLRRQAVQRLFGRLTTAMFLLVTAGVAWWAFQTFEHRRQVARNLSWLLAQQSRVAMAEGQNGRAMRLAVLAAQDTALSPAVASAHFQLGATTLAARRAMPLVGHADEVTSAGVSADGRWVVTGSLDGTARVWTLEDEDNWRTETLGRSGAAIVRVSVAPTGNRLATASSDGAVLVWSRSSGKWTSTHVYKGDGGIEILEFSEDGGLLMASTKDPVARLWREGRDGAWSPELLEGAAKGVTSAAVSADGQVAVTVQVDGTAWAWRRGSDRWNREALAGPAAAVATVADDGQRIVVGAVDGTARLWTRSSGRWQSTSLEGHLRSVRAVALNVDGSQVLTGSEDGTVRVWMADEKGRWVGEVLKGHTAMITSAHCAGRGAAMVDRFGGWNGPALVARSRPALADDRRSRAR